MDIVLHEGIEVPYEISRLITEELKETNARMIILTRDSGDLMKGHMAAFAPATMSIVIDLDKCVNDLRWMDQGATFIANAWFNLLYCIYHEAQHAWQQDWMFTMENWTEADLEEDADKYALSQMTDWFETHPIPKIEEMGYIGERIRIALNAIWAKHESLVERELKMAADNVAADAELAIQKSKLYEGPQEVAALRTAVEEGRVDKRIVDGRLVLPADEFLAINILN